MPHSAPQNSNPAGGGSQGYETREVNIKLILFSTVIVVGVVLVTCFVTVGIFDFLNAHSIPVDQTTTLERPKEVPPEPRVLEHPQEQFPVLRATEDRVLNSYGWLDQKTGVVRIPVDRAIDLIAERGLPVVGQAPAAPARKAPAPATRITQAKESSAK